MHVIAQFLNLALYLMAFVVTLYLSALVCSLAYFQSKLVYQKRFLQILGGPDNGIE